MTGKKELVTEDEISKLLKHLSDDYKSESNHETLVKLLRNTQIVIDDAEIDDSIDGTRIRVTYTTEIRRKETAGKGESIIGFQYIKEIPVDYGKIPVSLGGSSHAVDSDDPIISYDPLNEVSPSLREVLGLLKKVYFMPEDFSNRLAVDRIHKLREMFSKDEILAIPSVSLSSSAGLIPI
jgi:hypothetical protein